MTRRPIISIPRASEICKEMLWARRELYDDNEFFVMPDAWGKICEGNEKWVISAYRADPSTEVKRKAGVVVFGDCLTLTADERLFKDATRGCQISNFILAHELGHVALDHHAKGAVVKNFQLFTGPKGLSNLPPTLEELEANYAAVFFQCGVALWDTSVDILALARRASSDVTYVRKARSAVLLDAFQREMLKPANMNPRVIL